MDESHIGLLILSLFCAGGLYAYLREALRLHRLLSSGVVAEALIIDTEAVDAGSESVAHHLVRYAFTDERGERVVHESDLNSWRFFRTLSPGDSIAVVYGERTSHPLGQVRADRRIALWISAGIVVFWLSMSLVLG